VPLYKGKLMIAISETERSQEVERVFSGTAILISARREKLQMISSFARRYLSYSFPGLLVKRVNGSCLSARVNGTDLLRVTIVKMVD
jgi:hypothetical protein